MSRHIDPDDLAAIAIGGGEEPSHLAECPRCASDVSDFRKLVGELRGLPEPPEELTSKGIAYFERRHAIDELIARLAEDELLRARLSRDPVAVIREAGLEPSPELVAALRDIERGSAGAAERLAARLWF